LKEDSRPTKANVEMDLGPSLKVSKPKPQCAHSVCVSTQALHCPKGHPRLYKGFTSTVFSSARASMRYQVLHCGGLALLGTVLSSSVTTSFTTQVIWNSVSFCALSMCREAWMRTVTSRTRHTIVHAARRGAKNVKAVTGEAIGAAAKAATDVVLEKTGAALAAGRATLSRTAPSIKRVAEKTARQSLDKLRRKRTASRRRATVRRGKSAAVRRRKKARRNAR
jgi:hypothetical protein